MASAEARKPVTKLKGHTESVCCVVARGADHLAVSSGEVHFFKLSTFVKVLLRASPVQL